MDSHWDLRVKHDSKQIQDMECGASVFINLATLFFYHWLQMVRRRD